ncbi:MAG: zinc-binding dehydrogenase [Xanthobacteraceae bacterium]
MELESTAAGPKEAAAWWPFWRNQDRFGRGSSGAVNRDQGPLRRPGPFRHFLDYQLRYQIAGATRRNRLSISFHASKRQRPRSLIEQGKLKVVVDKTYPFARISEALACVERGPDFASPPHASEALGGCRFRLPGGCGRVPILDFLGGPDAPLRAAARRSLARYGHT